MISNFSTNENLTPHPVCCIFRTVINFSQKSANFLSPANGEFSIHLSALLCSSSVSLLHDNAELQYCTQMTVADFVIAFNIKHIKSGILDGIPTTIADSYPALSALHDSIIAEPKIAAFIAKHAK